MANSYPQSTDLVRVGRGGTEYKTTYDKFSGELMPKDLRKLTPLNAYVLPDTSQALVVSVEDGLIYIDGTHRRHIYAPAGTYTFNQVDASNSGHALWISPYKDGSGIASTSTGIPGNNGVTTLVAEPGVYYYGCATHPEMGGTIIIY